MTETPLSKHEVLFVTNYQELSTNFFGLSVKFKSEQVTIGSADNSKFKTQNSFIEHESLESNEYLDRIYD